MKQDYHVGFHVQFQILENNIGECFFNAFKEIMKTEVNVAFYLTFNNFYSNLLNENVNQKFKYEDFSIVKNALLQSKLWRKPFPVHNGKMTQFNGSNNFSSKKDLQNYYITGKLVMFMNYANYKI